MTTIKCVDCNTITDLPINDTTTTMTCPGCECNLCTFSAFGPNGISLSGNYISEITISPEIRDVWIIGAQCLTVLRTGRLNSLHLEDCRDVCAGDGEGDGGCEVECEGGYPGVCVFAPSIDRLNLKSPAAFPQTDIHMVDMYIATTGPVPECNTLRLFNRAYTRSTYIPLTIKCVQLFHLTHTTPQDIQRIIDNGNQWIELINMDITTLRYPSTLIELEINACSNLCQIIPPADDNLLKLTVRKCPLVVELPKFARLRSLTCLYQPDIVIPFMPSVDELYIEPFTRGLAEVYHFSEHMDMDLDICAPCDEDIYLTPEMRRRLTRIHARVHLIERWWIDVAHSPPYLGQPAGGVFYRRAMAAFMQARSR